MERRESEAFELAFELMRVGRGLGAKIGNFDAHHYLDAHEDVAAAGVDPLEHYLRFGMKEQRRILAAVRQAEHEGAQEFDPAKPTVLIVTHELSQTGAPIVALDLAKEAAETHNVVVASVRTGPLLDRVKEVACAVAITSAPHADFPYFTLPVFDKIDKAILNSVESHLFVRYLVAREIPFAAYIHEYATYTYPAHKTLLTALFADLLVFSSGHVRDSWIPVLEDVEVDQERDVTIVPQRRGGIGGVSAERLAEAREHLTRLIGKDCTGRRIVVGAGAAQWRKGTDIFAMTAQIARHRDPETLFVWVGDGFNPEDTTFGTWMMHHLREIGANDPDGNLFVLPAGDHYLDVVTASDAMLLSSRLDPLPNVVFDALSAGSRIVLFEGASGFTDASYHDPDTFVAVEYANPERAADALLRLPLKSAQPVAPPPSIEPLFSTLVSALEVATRLGTQHDEASAALDTPVLFSTADRDRDLRIRERERMMGSGRRMLWRDADEARQLLAASDSWVHQGCSIVDYAEVPPADLPRFSVHLHAFHVNTLHRNFGAYVALRQAERIVVTTDADDKADKVREAAAANGLDVEVLVVPNKGRDVVPFLELFDEGGPARADEVWCHIHEKRSRATTADGEVWRRFLMAILLGDEEHVSVAGRLAADPGTGLVAAFDPHYGQWNASRALLPPMANRLKEPLPANPMVYPIGNMFWVKGEVALAMRELFGKEYRWTNEPLPNDGTELHLIERLWPAVAVQCGLEAAFVSKPDQRRRV